MYIYLWFGLDKFLDDLSKWNTFVSRKWMRDRGKGRLPKNSIVMYVAVYSYMFNYIINPNDALDLLLDIHIYFYDLGF